MMSADSQSTTTELAVTGLTCNNCARKVTGIIQGFAGVASTLVSLERERATVRWSPDAQPDLPALLGALKNAGIVWDEATLDQWLADPQAFLPGAKMFYHLDQATDRADVIAFLKARAR